MTESLLLAADVGAAISLQEMVYSLKSDPLSDELTRSLEFIVGRGLQMASGLELAWTLATEDDKVWERGGYLRRMQALDFLANVVVDILSRTRDMVASTRERHPDWVAPQGAAEVDARLQSARELAARARKTLDWLARPRPPVSDEMVRRSREAYDRGEGEPVGEIIARLESGGPLVKE